MSTPSRIKNLYTYLVGNRRPQIDGWLAAYRRFSGEITTIRTALSNSGVVGLRDKATFAGTSFAQSDDPWQSFAKTLIYDRDNGISSRGQSVLSWNHFLAFVSDDRFVSALEEMIKEPNRETFDRFSHEWESARARHGAGRNPLLVNRALAACTTNVSSTVNGADFEAVFWWLVNEGLLERPSPEADWYDKNVLLMDYLRREFGEELDLAHGDPKRPDEHLLSIFVWELSQNLAPFSLKKQVVKYGAPGTGKTYTAKQNAELFFEIWRERYGEVVPDLDSKQCTEIVQFHPSYGYEDFLEGLRPSSSSEGGWHLSLQNGIFKEFCRRAGVWEIEVHRIPQQGPNLAFKWADLTVGQLRPHIGGPLKHPTWQAIAELDDSERIADVTPPFFFIIDEINRAELSRVLGELMYCIEYRGVGGAISTQYAALNTSETAMLETAAGPRFFIPHNVYLIGTMNTIDRSVESFDLALRRRFRWERIDPDIATLRYHLSLRDALPGNASRPWGKLADDLETLNEAIRKATGLLGPDYEIGHAYLMDLRYPATLNCSEVRSRIWEDSLQPLLEEYLRGSGRTESLLPEFKKAFGVS
jgi:5-methylcytosine-specific restriction protein B